MAAPAAVLSILVQANTGQATRGLVRFNQQLSGTEAKANHATRVIAQMGKVAGVGLAVGLGYAVKKAADFEQQMDSLGSVTEANAKQMERFRKQAMKAGADTKFSALEAAQAQTELAKGGLQVRQILRGGLNSALALAAAGELELAEAASTTANALNLFGLEGKASMKVADALAKAANATTADVADFAIALRQGGAVAKSAGLSFTETVLALEALAASGVKNSDAGTSLKTALIQLIKPTLKQKELAEKLNISFLDQEGRFKNLSDVSTMLRSRLGDMTKAQRTAALATLAGTDGVRTLTALYDAGAPKLDRWRKGLQEQGTAAEVAARKQDNLKGKLENLQGSVETAAIAIGTKLLPTLTDAAETITDLINNPNLTAGEKFSKFAELATNALEKAIPVMAAIGAKMAVAAAEGLARGWREMNPWLKLFTAAAVIRLVGGRGALFAVGGTVGRLLGIGVASGAATAAAGGAAAAGGGILGAMRSKILPFAKRAGLAGVGIALADSVISEFGRRSAEKSSDVFKALEALQGSKPFGADIFGAIDKFSEKITAAGGIPLLPKMLKNSEEAARALLPQLEAIAKSQRGIGHEKAEQLRATIHKLSDATPELRRKLFNLVDGFEATGEGARQARERIQRMGNESSRSIQELRNRVSYNTKLIREHIGTNTKRGRELMTENFRQAARNVRKSMQDKTITVKRGTELIEMYMVKALRNMGFSKADALALRKREPGSKQSPMGGELRPNQRGSYIDEGKPSGDSVPSLLERGEYVLNRNAVKKVGRRTLDKINYGMAPRFQQGGWVGDSPAGLNQAVKSMALWAMRKYGATASDTLRAPGTLTSSGNVSDHTTGAAVDLVSPNMLEMAKGLVQAFQPRIKQLIHTPLGYSINYGEKVAPFAQEDHYDHVHIAALGKAVAAIAAKIPGLEVKGPDSPMKALVQRTLDVTRAGAQKVVDGVSMQDMSAHGDVGLGKLAAGVSGSNMQMGLEMMLKIWSQSQWPALRELWTRESGWNEAARNPSSGAYGIPQSLPASKMGSAAQGTGMDAARAQIAWGLNYIKERYGSPSAALSFHDANNWYQKGGAVGYAGDSLGVGTMAAGLRAMLKPRNLRAAVKGGEPSSWGAGQLMGLIKKGTSVGMLDMGTNDGTVGNLRPSISQVEKKLGKRPLVMSTIVPKATDSERKNNAIRSMADYVVPWAANAGRYLVDGIHPNGAGYGKRAAMITAVIKKAAKASEKPNKPEKRVKPYKRKHLSGLQAPSGKDLFETLRMLRTGNQAERSNAIGKFLDHVRGTGLPQNVADRITDLTDQAAVLGEYADRAGQLTIEDAEGNVTPGIAADKTELQWLQEQLEVLFKLRNRLIAAQEAVQQRREQIAKLVDLAKDRLEKVAEEIKAVAKIRQSREKHLKELQKKPKQNRAAIKEMKTLLGLIDEDQAKRVRVRDGLEKRIIPALTGKGGSLSTQRGELLSSLEEVQGIAAPLGKLDALPGLGVLGGNIFDVQMRIRELQAPIEKITDSTTEEAGGERAELLAQLLREANLRTAVSERQFEVFRNFPPFGGQFHTGGVVDGPYGAERMAVVQSGEGVFTRDQMQAMGAGQIVVIVQDGAVREDRIRVLAGDEAVRAMRTASVKGQRRLPGGGGGLIG